MNSLRSAVRSAHEADSDSENDRVEESQSSSPDSTPESATPEVKPRGLDLPRGNGERVLLVDDEETVRRVTGRLLEKLGYVVRTAEDGEDALQILKDGQRFHLILTDVVMPRLTGIEMVEKIRTFLPDQKVLFTSGYTTRQYGHAPGEPPKPFMPKPFSMADLAQNVRSILDD